MLDQLLSFFVSACHRFIHGLHFTSSLSFPTFGFPQWPPSTLFSLIASFSSLSLSPSSDHTFCFPTADISFFFFRYGYSEYTVHVLLPLLAARETESVKTDDDDGFS